MSVASKKKLQNQPTEVVAEILEVSTKAVATGLIFGVIFGAANAYLGLRVGLTVSTSIPIAVLSIAVFRAGSAFWGKGTILEANLAQTIGSASSSLATGTIFTIPALFLWGSKPGYLQVAILALLGGILGVCAMIPLRRLLIVEADRELPYPEGRACAEVLKASERGIGASQWIFIGLAIGIFIKLTLGLIHLVPDQLTYTLPGLPKAILSLEVAPALIAVGYIVGYRASGIMVSGSLIAAIVLIPLIAIVGQSTVAPLFPEILKDKLTISAMSANQIWASYVRYIGAGAVAAAGTLTVLGSIPTMYASLTAILAGLKKKSSTGMTETERLDRDLPAQVVLAGAALVVLTLATIPGLLAGNLSTTQRILAALGVAIFGILFVAVSSRIVGLIGVSSNPVSGMTLVTLLATSAIFVALGWVDDNAKFAVLTVGTVVCIAASKSGDISQDLKTGYLVKATPYRQQAGQLLSASVACWAVAGTVLALGAAYQFGSQQLPAPQATLMKTVIEGVLSGSLPWSLVGVGVAFAIAAVLAGLPGLAFAIGLYLPLASMTPIFLGGLVRKFVDGKDAAKSESGAGILCASGLIAGEGIAGICIAAAVAFGKVSKDVTTLLTGTAGIIGALAIIAIVLFALYHSSKENSEAK
ncbi:MAG: oligopeptide transporter, OPT family [Acidobacteriota bacterium]|nr:oligopeptide transporter, OPT family [Blastocatellia bacterium]MDW8413159.1 oligopeptide transporter, OPT family [Acidobacteriota bacterium]